MYFTCKVTFQISNLIKGHKKQDFGHKRTDLVIHLYAKVIKIPTSIDRVAPGRREDIKTGFCLNAAAHKAAPERILTRNISPHQHH